MRLILASSSPRRADLLASAGFAFDVDPAEVDERLEEGEAPAAYVERVARMKAAAGARRHPDRLVIGADTAVVLDDTVLGKPVDEEDARAMLRRLSGRAHDVLTGVAVASDGELVSRVERTTVWFRDLSDEEIEWYAASREPMDKAGAYAIQGLAARFIPRIAGSYSNVVGLPVSLVAELVGRVGSGRPIASAAPGPYPEW
jgi:septum formation protein